MAYRTDMLCLFAVWHDQRNPKEGPEKKHEQYNGDNRSTIHLSKDGSGYFPMAAGARSSSRSTKRRSEMQQSEKLKRIPAIS
jgi:hypothetical protein